MRSRWSESWSHFEGLIHPNDVVVRNVRIQTNAGWYIGTVEFYDFDEMGFYSRDGDYYPNEEIVKNIFPNSISIEEAFHKVKHDRLLKRKLEKKKRWKMVISSKGEMKMKAFRVFYIAGSKQNSMIVLVEDESDLEQAVSNKDMEFEVDSKWSKINTKYEIPLSNVLVSDLSVTELLCLLKGK
jgi:hypothetical protein